MIHEYLPADCRERIKDLLKEREMSQAQLAEKIGISESAFSRYLSGQTDKLSTENIVAIAKVFDVTTDFLLCLTDISFTTNFDIEKLGLSVKAAEKLLQRKVDPTVVSQLIELPAFNRLIFQLAAVQRGVLDAGYQYMNEMFSAAKTLYVDHVQDHPEDRQAAKNALADIRALAMIRPEANMAGVEDAMRQIVTEFRKGADSYLAETQKLTSEIMRKITGHLQKQLNHPMKLQGITPEMMVDGIIHYLQETEMTDDQLRSLRSDLIPLFTKPSDLAEQKMLTDDTMQ